MNNSDVIALGYKFGLLPVINEEDDQTFYANIDELRQYTEMLVRACANIAYNNETFDGEISNAILEHFGLNQ